MEGGGHVPFNDIFRRSSGQTEEVQNKSVKIVGHPSEIRDEHSRILILMSSQNKAYAVSPYIIIN